MIYLSNTSLDIFIYNDFGPTYAGNLFIYWLIYAFNIESLYVYNFFFENQILQ